MHKSIPIVLLLLFYLLSCHFYDNRLIATNLSEMPMYFSVWDYSLSDRNDLKSPFFLISPGEKRAITLDQNLRYEHIQSDSIKVLVVSVNNHNSVRKPTGYHAFEELIDRDDVIVLNIATSNVIESAEVILNKDKIIYIE